MNYGTRTNRSNATVGCYTFRDSSVGNVRVPYVRKDIFSFFLKPKLKIEFDDPKNPDVNTFAPSLEITPEPHDRIVLGSKLKRRYLKVRIKNSGKELATNCEGEIRITKWPSGVSPPSTDGKPLSWDQVPSDTSRHRNIRTKKRGELLNIIFVDSRLEGKTGDVPYAFISTPEALSNLQNRSQDSIRVGEYEAELEVTSDNGAYCMKKIYFKIDKAYDSAFIKEK